MGQGWERLAERAGGTVMALATATDAAGATVVYAATAVGLYQSRDGGRTWAASGLDQRVPFTEAVAPSSDFARDRTLFVGARDGLYRSRDGGQRWQRRLTGSRVFAVAQPQGARERPLFAGTAADGILRSDDGGECWTGANVGLLDLTVLALAFSPRFARDQTGFAATASGLYRTRNGGKSWRTLDLPIEEPAVQCLAISPDFAADGLVLAGTEADGMLRSDDGGATWETVPALAGRSVSALAFATGVGPDRPIAGVVDGSVVTSRNGGLTWEARAQPAGAVISLAFVPTAEGEALLAGLDRHGVARSTDGGVTWAPASAGLRARLPVGLVFSPAFDEDATLFLASLDEGVVRSTDGGATWTACPVSPDAPAVYAIALSPRYAADRTVYAATAAGLYRSRDRGTTWGLAAPLTVELIVAGPALDGGSAALFAIDQTGQLLASDDEGATWRALDTSGAFGDAPVIALALAPGEGRTQTIFAGASQPAPDDGARVVGLWRSTDGGARWERWLEERGQPPLALAAPRASGDDTIFVGLGRRVLRPRPRMWETRGGIRQPSWRGAVLDGEAATVIMLAVSPDYQRDGAVFAATNRGVYRSTDRGQTFRPWHDGLSPASVLAVAVSPYYATDRLVYAVGLGGAIWRRRDAS